MKYDGQIVKHDNVITQSRTEYLYDTIRYTCKWNYGEVDDVGLPPTGLICNLFNNGQWEYKEIHDELFVGLVKVDPWFETAKLQRSYINMFRPNEEANIHIDGQCITALFYINPYMQMNHGGETQFFVDGDMVGSLPYPNRMVIFDGMIPHKATPFRWGRHDVRITVAMKFDK